MNRAAVKITDWDDNKMSNYDNVIRKVSNLDPMWDGYVTMDQVRTHKGDGVREVESLTIWFDRELVRPTWVHGWACDAGFIASVVA